MRLNFRTIGFVPMTMMLCLFLASCSNEDEMVDTPKEPAVKSVLISDGQILNASTRASQGEGEFALCFENEAALQDFKSRLQIMSDDSKMKIVNQYGVTNLHDVADKADQELEAIGEKATSMAEFREMYDEYVNKYKDVLVTNGSDAEDLTLYVPDEDNVETFICNSHGEYVVGNEIRKANISKTLANPVYKTMLADDGAMPPVTGVNSIRYNPRSNLRIYFEAYMVNIRLWVKMHAQKHMWYGWKNDPNRHYYFKSYISSNFVYLGEGQYGQEITVNRLPLYLFENNVKNGFNIILGKITTGVKLTGNFLVWSDNDIERDANDNLVTEVVNGVIVPKCETSRAHNVQIDLTPQN